MKTLAAAALLALATLAAVVPAQAGFGPQSVTSFDGPAATQVPSFDGPAFGPSDVRGFDGPAFGPADVRGFDGPALGSGDKDYDATRR